jgi:hypothetical protein
MQKTEDYPFPRTEINDMFDNRMRIKRRKFQFAGIVLDENQQ